MSQLFCACVSRSTQDQVSRDELATSFKGWEPETQALIHCIDSLLRWAIHTPVRPLPSFISEGSVAFLEDVAHAMCPHQGSGASQAIEDTYLAAALLGSSLTTRSSIPRALEIYDQICRPQAFEVQEESPA
ncbi:hypothetical protein FISHEDRAFT_75261 [Fistulina hepatica ATCC 64428]|uniref:FAD-binding domain-containing protein n=1 Tax=Fistulina hepatica ATCC 64428 TaxID=1128425 RepID=A0A0D7A7R0_9AGAR|nr:hypothetical protein FISHEDRAFT_75261 [Fistulina hepatica ATCC 64428]